MRISNEDFRKWNTWLRYALRRVLRIYPMFSFIVLLSYLATPHGLFLYQMSWDVAVQHLLLQRGDSVLWSIPVEMAYYVALPFVAIALRACRDTTSAVAMTVAAITLSTALWPPGDWPENSTHLGYYLPVFFAGSFAAFLNIRCNLSRNLVHSARRSSCSVLCGDCFC